MHVTSSTTPVCLRAHANRVATRNNSRKVRDYQPLTYGTRVRFMREKGSSRQATDIAGSCEQPVREQLYEFCTIYRTPQPPTQGNLLPKRYQRRMKLWIPYRCADSGKVFDSEIGI
jgi:hypothetical protein